MSTQQTILLPCAKEYLCLLHKVAQVKLKNSHCTRTWVSRHLTYRLKLTVLYNKSCIFQHELTWCIINVKIACHELYNNYLISLCISSEGFFFFILFFGLTIRSLEPFNPIGLDSHRVGPLKGRTVPYQGFLNYKGSNLRPPVKGKGISFIPPHPLVISIGSSAYCFIQLVFLLHSFKECIVC